MNSEPSRGHCSDGDPNIAERRYREPPIVEALCEVHFADSNWDDTIPGTFYERVKKDFPQKRQRQMQQAQIELGRREATAGVHHLPPWMQFVAAQGNRMVQVAENLLVVNQMQPYPHFEDWEPIIHQMLEIYTRLTQPATVARIGLRYINRIAIPGEKILLEDYFNIYPRLPSGIGSTHASFLVRVEVPQIGDGHTALITFGTAPASGPYRAELAFMLDLYDIFRLDKAVEGIDFKKEIHTAHSNMICAFENSITDRLRELFGQE